ncbi:NAD(P)-dependent oxidoreductase [Actinospica sp.]|jgi:nucleoside-diphosphate-sugar epimerase|uniref:NAD-dependent epimerase/dehydratase family protein n=1 Tax=Actinospica sp. TaxID=1872142 RepID=UPI002C285120|nr:NAD(P)-dependent oxidoreductase [Actinospica sp.]HWG27764.1 NAD(P)-dependent oxidoreductase [Actinospica sp.]
MRILVAGATGAIGRLLVPMLLAAGHEVGGTSRSDEGAKAVDALGASGLRMDALSAESVNAAVRAFRPEIIVHQLTTLGERDFAANSRLRVQGTRNLVDAALELGAQRIVAQSISWVYEGGDTPADETVALDADPQRAAMMTGVRALESESARMPEHVVLRYGALYGPGTWHERGGFVAQQLRAGSITANDGVSSFVHVEDAARAAVAALEWPNGVVNIVDDEPAPAREWLPALAAALGEPAPAIVPGRAAWERGASNRRARAELGWTPGWPAWRTGFAAQ